MNALLVDNYIRKLTPLLGQQPNFVYLSKDFEFPTNANIVRALLDEACEQKNYRDLALLRSDRATFTYEEVRERVNRIANVLVEDCGLIPGNRVLLRGGNSIGMALSWLAVVKAGGVAVATMPLLRAKELGDIVEKAKPTIAICDASLRDELDQAIFASGEKIEVIVFNLPDSPEDLGSRAAQKSNAFVAYDSSADDVAMMAFTSGTTGKPKAALHTHRDLLCACNAWPKHVLKATQEDIVIGSPPLAFTFGLGGLLLFPMSVGASVYFPSKPYTPESMVQTICEVGATITYTAPTFYRQMATFAKGVSLPTLKKSVSAGEGLPDATRTLWREATGIEMTDGIGATEMFHIFISSPPEEFRRGAIGKVVPGYIAKVVDDDGNEVPRGTVGKLAVIGPTGCKYLDDPRQANYVKNGWNYPGDAFLQDEDGYFFYQARADDMIITSGYNVGGPEVEDALLKHPAVAECGVVGKPDEERGMIVKAFVVLKPNYANETNLVKTLQDHVKSMLAPYKYPREIEFRTSLPRTETGKLQRFKLRAEA
ncbi:MAG: AMP-binding protein [Casimicrobium sp.]